MNKQKNWTGERLETFITDETMTEHLHRYAFAMEFIAGKKVLDIACGEGYGTNLMAKKAFHVTGIDIDKACIENAEKKYKADNISFSTGSVLKIPAENNSFDIVACFETLEHVNEHPEVLTELKRVLSPSGILLISTPDKKNYSDKPGYLNPFHKKELYEQEFKDLISSYFPYSSFFNQLHFTGSIIHAADHSGIQKYYKGEYDSIQADNSEEVHYWIAIASENVLPVLNGSLFKHYKPISQLLDERAEAVKKTITYRVGNTILFPFKFILSLFKK